MAASWTQIGSKSAYVYSATGVAPYIVVNTASSTTALGMTDVFNALYSNNSSPYVLPSGFGYNTSEQTIGAVAGSGFASTTVEILAVAIKTQIEFNLMHAHNPIEVNFNVAIDAESNITVLGEAAPSVTNVVIAEYELPVNALYDRVGSKGLIEMWEPSDEPGKIKVKFAETDSSAFTGGENLSANGGVWKETVRKLGRGLQKVLVNPLDASAAAPFSDAKYAGVTAYTTQRDFGRLALGAFAHYMFGHVDATVAITNDTAFVKSMLSLSTDAAAVDENADVEGTGPLARFTAWAQKSEVDTLAFNEWKSAVAATSAGSAADANLAQRLTQVILNKGLASDGSLIVSEIDPDSATPTSALAHIVRQVIGQDAQRTKMRDGSERTRDVHQLVRFYENDVIYVNINVAVPTVTVGAGQGGVTKAALEAAVTAQNYTIKITLGAAVAEL
jgi:hypothetical protein